MIATLLMLKIASNTKSPTPSGKACINCILKDTLMLEGPMPSNSSYEYRVQSTYNAELSSSRDMEAHPRVVAIGFINGFTFNAASKAHALLDANLLRPSAVRSRC